MSIYECGLRICRKCEKKHKETCKWETPDGFAPILIARRSWTVYHHMGWARDQPQALPYPTPATFNADGNVNMAEVD